MQSENHVSDLLVSRFTHDLANPLGVIRNGLELLELSGAENTPEMELVQQSLVSAQAKLHTFRKALGASRADASTQTSFDIVSQDWARTSRLSVQNAPNFHSDKQFQLFLNLML